MLKCVTIKKFHLNSWTLFIATDNWVNIQLFSFSSNKMNWGLTHQLKSYFWASGRNFQLSRNWKLKKIISKHHKRFFVTILSLSTPPYMYIFGENCNTGLSSESCLFLLSAAEHRGPHVRFCQDTYLSLVDSAMLSFSHVPDIRHYSSVKELNHL